MEEDRRRDEERRRREDRTVRGLRIAGVLLLALALSWWIYGSYVASPSLLPVATSPERTVQSSADSWPATGAGPGRHRQIDAASRIRGEPAWTTDLRAPVSVAMIGDDARLYVATEDYDLVALSIADGDVAWERRYEQRLRVAPTLAADLLFVLVPIEPGATLLHAVDAGSGDPQWEARIESEVQSAALVDLGTVYVAAQNEIVGFDAETGEQLWRVDVPTDWALIDRPFLSAVMDESYLVIGTAERILVFDRATGQETYWWDFLSFPEHLVLADGTLYGLSHRFLAAIDPASERPWWDSLRGAWGQAWIWGMAPPVPPPPREWVRSNPPRTILPPAVDEERIYLAGARGGLRAHARATGEVLWERNSDWLVSGPIRTRDGLLLTADDQLLLIDPASGAELDRRSFEEGGLREVVPMSHGTYIVRRDGTITALR